MITAYDIIIKPIITEKSMALTEANKYTFKVMKKANKTEVKKAVETVFGVKVEKVNMFQVYAYLFYSLKQCACRGAGDQDLISHSQFSALHLELGYAKPCKILDASCDVLFSFRSARSVMIAPFAEPLSEVISVPEAAVEDRFQPFVPCGDLFVGKRTFAICLYGLLVARCDDMHVFRSARPTLELEHAHARIHHLVHKMNRF